MLDSSYLNKSVKKLSYSQLKIAIALAKHYQFRRLLPIYCDQIVHRMSLDELISTIELSLSLDTFSLSLSSIEIAVASPFLLQAQKDMFSGTKSSAVYAAAILNPLLAYNVIHFIRAKSEQILPLLNSFRRMELIDLLHIYLFQLYFT